MQNIREWRLKKWWKETERGRKTDDKKSFEFNHELKWKKKQQTNNNKKFGIILHIFYAALQPILPKWTISDAIIKVD